MEAAAIDLELEKNEILRRYRGLLRAAVHSRSAADRRAIRKAFDLALEAHKDMRRKSGEPYIYHPIGVARIVAEEMGLDTTSIVCALLQDTVEDTYMTLDDVGNLFGERERNIVDGLTKMSGVFEPGTSAQAENFRKMLLTLSNDVRVILIKIADRLDNMRTLEHMRPDKQQKIASETLFMYAPLAHRLGLYGIKTELEDLALKYKEPEAYHDIEAKLRKTQSVRTRFINAFTLPIRRALDVAGMTYEIRSRTKSIFSIWQKMQKQRVTFEEVYDVFAIRIILDTPYEREKADAWRTYSIVTDYYQPAQTGCATGSACRRRTATNRCTPQSCRRRASGSRSKSGRGGWTRWPRRAWPPIGATRTARRSRTTPPPPAKSGSTAGSTPSAKSSKAAKKTRCSSSTSSS